VNFLIWKAGCSGTVLVRIKPAPAPIDWITIEIIRILDARSSLAMSGEIEWTQISAIAACFGVAVASAAVIVAIIFHSKNLKHARLSNSAKMVWDLVELFDSAEWLGHRSQFAKMLLQDRPSIDLRRDSPVAEFFEELAYMTKRGVLDKGMVWNSFFWPLEHYYPALTTPPSLIEKARADSGAATLYRELPWLYGELCVVCAKEEGSSAYLPPSAQDIKQFLEDEIKLAGPSANGNQSG
jgi:hypothetical protein